MNVIRFCSLNFFILFLSVMTVHADIFLDAGQTVPTQASKTIDKKKLIRKSSLEFKQAIVHYIKHTDFTCFQNVTQSSDEKAAYKKELHYLFKNYGKFSAVTLLSRLRSVHRLMMKQNSSIESEIYQKYEQICSALLLICVQVFFNEIRNQLLQALHEIDNLLVYWRYQQSHQLYYFFGKSPLKWIVGKGQAQEIIHNIIKLERKQKELYTLLGSLTGHAYSFTEMEMTYDDCYTWIGQLLEKVECIKTVSHYDTDKSKFDEISAGLEAKFKRVSKFKADCLASIAAAKKANYFVRNWIIYTALLAATAYSIHYNSKNPEVIGSAVNAVHNEASKFLILLLHPLQKIYERGKLAFSDEKKKPEEAKKALEKEEGDLEAQWMDVLGKVKTDKKDDMSIQKAQLQVMQDMVKNADTKTRENIEISLKRIEAILANQSSFNEKEIDEYQAALNEVESFILDVQLGTLANKAKQLGQGADAAIDEQLAKSITSVRQDGLAYIAGSIEKVKNPKDSLVGDYFQSDTKQLFQRFDENELKDALKRVKNIVEPIKDKETKIVINQDDVDRYQKDIEYISAYIEDAIGLISMRTENGLRLVLQLGIGLILLRMDSDFLSVLHKYTIIIGGQIIPLVDVIALIAENLGIQFGGLIKQSVGVVKQATEQLKNAEQQLKDHELTLMFTSLIPLGIIALGTSKLYQWAIARNYSPIRIALADINSLLIEATNHLDDDHDYGKLVYLIYQLRHKSLYLKDSLAKEFLDDVAKIESRQYTTQIKRGIVENMFNKYAFLGKVST